MATRSLRVLFAGASRAVGLLERFRAAAASLGVGLEMFVCDDPSPWHAVVVSGLATHVPSPPFATPGFHQLLVEVVVRRGVDIVVPLVDEAVLGVARARESILAAGAVPLVSSLEVCEAMADKRQAEALFRSLGLRTPCGTRFPLVAKPRFGEGSRGMAVLRGEEELECWLRGNRREEFLLQPLLSGPEFTVDGYVDGTGRTLGLVSRVRAAVVGGEVSITCTRRNEAVLALAERLLRWNRWRGPVSVQAMVEGGEAWLLECNPRLGGGATCSIEAGLAIPEWILRERLGLPLPAAPVAWDENVCSTRSWRDHFLRLPPAG